MKLAIMQPYFLPYIGYFQLISAVDEFVILDDVNFIKGGWINRNRILLDGKEKYITKPVNGASQNKKINELRFVDNPEERINMMRTISYAFRHSCYFPSFEPLIRDIILDPHLSLPEYLEYSISNVCNMLGIDTKISRSSSFRGSVHSCGQAGIIELCKLRGCDNYFNAIGGLKIYDKTAFNDSNIELRFLKTDYERMEKISTSEHLDYSILEIMADHNENTIKQLLSCFIII